MEQTIASNTIVKPKHTFAYGWGLQVLVGLMFFFYAGIAVDGQNITVPTFVANQGWDYGSLLALATPAGWFGLVGIFIFSHIVSKRGVKFVIVLTLIGSGVVCFFYGFSNSILMYAITYFLLVFFTNGYGNVATGALTANWFPRRRGYALGWSSMGMPVSSALYVLGLSFLINKLSINTAMSIVGTIVIVLGITAIFWVKNTPEEMGLVPDNDPTHLADLDKMRHEMQNYVSSWTIIRLLSSKVVWMQGICYGLLFLTTVGLISQMVPRLMGLGYSLEFGLGMIALASGVGIIGSVAWGIIDMKIGTKKATIIYALWYAAAVIILLSTTHSTIGTIIGVCMAGWGIGGIGNLQPSMLAQTFGRFDYASASRVVNTIVGFIRVSAFAVIGGAVHFTGSIDRAYFILIAGNIVAFILAVLIDDKLVGKKG